MHHITDRIEAKRLADGISVASLAEKTAIPRQTLTRRLSDPASFTLTEITRVADVLGLDPADLMRGAA